MGKSYDDHVDLAMPPAAALRTLYDAIGAIAKADSLQVDGWVVTATVGTGWKSWGEKVAGRVLTGPGGTRVEVKSACRLATQVIDMGKNKQNVRQVLAAFQPPAGQPPGPPPQRW